MAEMVAGLAAYVFVEVLLLGIFYWPGWLILRTVTVGRYPPPRGRERNEEFVACVALVVFIAAITVYFSR